jgi:two-component system sensor histidine kinase KdpD
LRAEDAPGGGLTMVLAVPTAPARRPEKSDLPATAAH